MSALPLVLACTGTRPLVRWSVVPAAPSAAAAAANLSLADVDGLRMLHVITSFSDSNTLGRGTVPHSSRLPVLQFVLKGVAEACEAGLELSVVLIAGWAAEAKRETLARALSRCRRPVRLGIWEKAVPSRVTADGQAKAVNRALAQQHRFVLARELGRHHLFSCWEDDMRVGLAHVVHYVRTSRALEEAAAAAEGEGLDPAAIRNPPAAADANRLPDSATGLAKLGWKEPLQPQHLLRVLPAFLRVEVSRFGQSPREATTPSASTASTAATAATASPATAATAPTAPTVSSPAATALSAAYATFTAFAVGSSAAAAAAAAAAMPTRQSGESGQTAVLRAKCCAEPSPVSYPREEMIAKTDALRNVTAGELLSWEWDAAAMGVRQLPPPFGWVGVIPALSGGWLASYTGAGPTLDDHTAHNSLLWGQQGGWMLTRAQLHRMQLLCPGGFLPPPEAEALPGPWMWRYNVEFWSGGFQLFNWRYCGMARVLLLGSTADFGGHLVMHATGNKQRQLPRHMRRVGSTLHSLWMLARAANSSAATATAAADSTSASASAGAGAGGGAKPTAQRPGVGVEAAPQANSARKRRGRTRREVLEA